MKNYLYCGGGSGIRYIKTIDLGSRKVIKHEDFEKKIEKNLEFAESTIYYMEPGNDQGEILLSVLPDCVFLYNVNESKIIKKFKSHTGGAWFMKNFPEQNFFFSCGWDNNAFLWSCEKKKPLIKIFNMNQYMNGGEFISNKNFIVTCSVGVDWYDVTTGKACGSFTNDCGKRTTWVESCGGNLIVSTGNKTQLYDIASNKLVSSFADQKEQWCVRYCKEKNLLVSCGYDNIMIFDIRKLGGKALKDFKSHSSWAYRIRLINDESFAVGSEDEKVRILDYSGKCLNKWTLNQHIYAMSYFGDRCDASLGLTIMEKKDLEERLLYIAEKTDDSCMQFDSEMFEILKFDICGIKFCCCKVFFMKEFLHTRG